MAVDRRFWTVWFEEKELHGWCCPHCNNGRLEALGGSLQSRWISKTPHGNPGDWLGRFTYLLNCPTCNRPVAVLGDISAEQVVVEGEPNMHWATVYRPIVFMPPIDLFAVSGRCPRSLAVILRAAFGLFRMDPAACANRIRAAVEELLTLHHIRRYASHKGRRSPLPTHQRLELFRKSEPMLGDALLAVKWIGNAGSHSGKQVTTSDLFDAFDMLEHVIGALYDNEGKRIQALARRINRRRKPIGN